MNAKNVLLIVSIIAIISSVIVFAFDLSNIERVRQANQKINQSTLEPGLPAPPRPENQVLTVPLSGVLFTMGLILIAFYFAFSFLDQSFKKDLSLISQIVNETSQNKNNSDSDVQKTILNLINPTERQIVEKLVENHGTCLQSDISRMNNMGKVKAHRYVHNLAKMGIVIIERYGNTNKIILSDQLKKIIH